MKGIRLGWVILLLGLVGCDQKQAGFQLKRRELSIGQAKLLVEVADTPEMMQKGLMHRASLEPNTGMLFVYREPQQVSFWMKNTQIPLSIGFVGQDGTLLEVRDLKPLDETPVKSASSTVVYAIETPQGWFNYAGIKPGTKVTGLP